MRKFNGGRHSGATVLEVDSLRAAKRGSDRIGSAGLSAVTSPYDISLAFNGGAHGRGRVAVSTTNSFGASAAAPRAPAASVGHDGGRDRGRRARRSRVRRAGTGVAAAHRTRAVASGRVERHEGQVERGVGGHDAPQVARQMDERMGA